MSDIAICPTCRAKAKIKTKDGETIYKAVQDEEAFKKIEQIKKMAMKFKEKAERLEEEIKQLKMES